MFQNIGEYILSDIHFQLWMVAAVHRGVYTSSPQTTVAGDTRRTIACTADLWHPNLVAQFPDPIEIPDRITCTGVTHHVNGRGQFHNGKRSGPTVTVDEMIVEWGDLNFDRELFVGPDGDMVEDIKYDTNERKPHSLKKTAENRWREKGPCVIRLKKLKKWHHEGVLNRRRGDAVICRYAEFLWATEQMRGFYRENGPYKVVLKNFSAECNMGSIGKVSSDPPSHSWMTHSNKRLGDARVLDLIAKKKIRVNLMDTDDVFHRAGDAFVFWSELMD